MLFICLNFYLSKKIPNTQFLTTVNKRKFIKNFEVEDRKRENIFYSRQLRMLISHIFLFQIHIRLVKQPQYLIKTMKFLFGLIAGAIVSTQALRFGSTETHIRRQIHTKQGVHTLAVDHFENSIYASNPNHPNNPNNPNNPNSLNNEGGSTLNENDDDDDYDDVDDETPSVNNSEDDNDSGINNDNIRHGPNSYLPGQPTNPYDINGQTEDGQPDTYDDPTEDDSYNDDQDTDTEPSYPSGAQTR